MKLVIKIAWNCHRNIQTDKWNIIKNPEKDLVRSHFRFLNKSRVYISLKCMRL